MDIIQIIVLALVQGLTEFLPISSSAHLILVPVLTDWEDQGLAFDIAVHAGTLTAVVLYFRHGLVRMVAEWIGSHAGESTKDSHLAWMVLIGTIPVGLAGLFFKDFISEYMRAVDRVTKIKHSSKVIISEQLKKPLKMLMLIQEE